MKTTEKSKLSITQKTNKVVYKGLCMNCENRKDCMYIHKNKSVNYCEEYA